MQLEKVRIAGFRSYDIPIDIEIDAHSTVIAGRNDAGKSSVLEALEAFFDDKVDVKDFSVRSEGPIEVTCQFSDLPSSVTIDAKFATSLSDEYLLDAAGKLSVKKTWSRGKTGSPAVSVFAVHPTADTGDLNLLELKQQGLKAKARELGIANEAIRVEGDGRTNTAYRRAIWSSLLDSGDARLTKREVTLSKEDGLNVAKALSNYYPYFHLFRSDRASDETEPLAQDPVKLIVKEVLDEHIDQLSMLSSQIEKQINQKLSSVISKLSEVAPDMAASLTAQDLTPKWQNAYGKAQFVDENDVPLARRGSGTRRLVLLSFFRAEAERDIADSDDNYHRGVITAVEEPETALHSDLQKQIVSSLLDVSERSNRQVLLTTHSSNLLREVPATSIRYIRRETEGPRCISAESPTSGRELLESLNASLGIFTDHDVRCFILVEGRRDKEGLLRLSRAVAEKVGDDELSLEWLESQGRISFMPIGGGGNLSLWESNLSAFNRHEFYIIDSDRKKRGDKLKPEVAELQASTNDNRHACVLDRRELENYLTVESVIDSFPELDDFEDEFRGRIASVADWHYADIPTLVAQAAHSANADSKVPWESLSVDKRGDKESRAKKRLAEAFGHSSVVDSVWSENCDLKGVLEQVRAKVIS
jgi:putative ATP-dependent endonuclease of the OLD family